MADVMKSIDLYDVLGQSWEGAEVFAVDQFGATRSAVTGARVEDDGTVVIDIEVEDRG